MGPIANPKLVPAVTNAGALGMLSGMVIDTVDLEEKVLRELKSSTTGPFGVNFIVPLMKWKDLEEMVPISPLGQPELLSSSTIGPTKNLSKWCTRRRHWFPGK